MTQREPPDKQTNIVVVILAAGASSRMGQHKLLLPLAGKPVIAWPVLAACASRASEVILIVGRDAQAVRAALPPGRHRTLINTDYERGQGTSLALAAAFTSSEVAGLIVLLADQPFMDTNSIDRVFLAAEREPDRIIMGSVLSHAGHPVYLPRRLFADLRALSGDRGARDIISRERASALLEPLANDFAHFDVDTSSDYQRALELAYRLESPLA